MTVPILYQKFFIKRNIVYMYALSMLIFLFSDFLNFVAATRYNLEIGIPDTVMYFLGGQLAVQFELSLIIFPTFMIFSKLTPPGIESTFSSVTVAILMISIKVFRTLTGLLINKFFFGVKNNEDMDGYVYLKLINFATSFLPFLYMWKFVPTNEEIDVAHEK